MSEVLDKTSLWESVLRELDRLFNTGRIEEAQVTHLRDRICDLLGASLPPREMRKHLPDDVKERARAIFRSSMAAGDVARVHDLLWHLGVPLGLWERVYPQSTPDYVLKELALEAVSSAMDKQQYGTACALAEFGSDTDLADAFRTLARKRCQRIVLNYASGLYQTRGQ